MEKELNIIYNQDGEDKPFFFRKQSILICIASDNCIANLLSNLIIQKVVYQFFLKFIRFYDIISNSKGIIIRHKIHFRKNWRKI